MRKYVFRAHKLLRIFEIRESLCARKFVRAKVCALKVFTNVHTLTYTLRAQTFTRTKFRGFQKFRKFSRVFILQSVSNVNKVPSSNVLKV